MKSVQRGSLSHKESVSSGTYTKRFTIPISNVDTSKSVLFYDLETERYYPDSDRVISAALNANNISVLWMNNDNRGTVTFVGDWQVVEFY